MIVQDTNSPTGGSLIINSIKMTNGSEIGMCHCPGRNHVDSSGQHWNRNLTADFNSIKSWGAKALITLNEDHEFPQLGVADFADQARNSGLAWYHLPIADMRAPDAIFEDLWVESGTLITQSLQQGEKILIHCAGGLGRTGTLVARLLIDSGQSASVAIDTVRSARPGAIETSVQEQHLHEYSALHWKHS